MEYFKQIIDANVMHCLRTSVPFKNISSLGRTSNQSKMNEPFGLTVDLDGRDSPQVIFSCDIAFPSYFFCEARKKIIGLAMQFLIILIRLLALKMSAL